MNHPRLLRSPPSPAGLGLVPCELPSTARVRQTGRRSVRNEPSEGSDTTGRSAFAPIPGPNAVARSDPADDRPPGALLRQPCLVFRRQPTAKRC